jgi:hypothetical protein
VPIQIQNYYKKRNFFGLFDTPGIAISNTAGNFFRVQIRVASADSKKSVKISRLAITNQLGLGQYSVNIGHS